MMQRTSRWSGGGEPSRDADELAAESADLIERAREIQEVSQLLRVYRRAILKRTQTLLETSRELIVVSRHMLWLTRNDRR